MDLNIKSANKDDAFTFIGEGAFSGKAGELRVERLGEGKSVVMGDVNGDGVADFALTVLHTGSITADNFWF